MRKYTVGMYVSRNGVKYVAIKRYRRFSGTYKTIVTEPITGEANARKIAETYFAHKYGAKTNRYSVTYL